MLTRQVKISIAVIDNFNEVARGIDSKCHHDPPGSHFAAGKKRLQVAAAFYEVLPSPVWFMSPRANPMSFFPTFSLPSLSREAR